jgi:hypothetical protein
LIFLTLLITDFALDRWLARQQGASREQDLLSELDFERHAELDTQQDDERHDDALAA